MAHLTVTMIAFFVGLVCYAVISIASNLIHRQKKKFSFIIVPNDTEAFVKKNPMTTAITDNR